MPQLRERSIECYSLVYYCRRFTSGLAKVAAQVTAVDVSEAFIRENRARHQHLPHVFYICDDVVKYGPKMYGGEGRRVGLG